MVGRNVVFDIVVFCYLLAFLELSKMQRIKLKKVNVFLSEYWFIYLLTIKPFSRHDDDNPVTLGNTLPRGHKLLVRTVDSRQ